MKKLLKNPDLKIILCEVHSNLLPLFNSSEQEVKEIILNENFNIDYTVNRENSIPIYLYALRFLLVIYYQATKKTEIINILTDWLS